MLLQLVGENHPLSYTVKYKNGVIALTLYTFSHTIQAEIPAESKFRLPAILFLLDRKRINVTKLSIKENKLK